jgi:hypothetical protein
MAGTSAGGKKRITKLEVTEDTLTSRGGLAFFVKYVESLRIVELLLSQFAGMRKNAKGVRVKNMLLQVLYFFFDGTSRHLNYFDELKKDEGYTAVIEMADAQVASSHAVKRFFGAFGIFKAWAFRWALKELFIARLRAAGGKLVQMTLDTMVMDNDEAEEREGCDPTYKKVKGFQPLQLIWEGKIIDAIFRRGKRHSNYGNDVEKMIRGIVKLIRTRYDASVLIVIRLDAGFFDEKIFRLCDELGVAFVATGKVYENIKKQVAALDAKEWKEYANARQSWSYAAFPYQCESWKRGYRALYTRPQYEDRQQLLEFARPDNIIVTNLAAGAAWFDALSADMREYWLEDKTVIFHHHQRGADELPNRGLKEFGSEQLPFKRFAANQAWYYMMLLGFFVFQIFKEDNFKDILPLNSYPTTVRRKLIDLAAKIVCTGHECILKVSQAAMQRLQLQTLWTRCQEASPIPLTS